MIENNNNMNLIIIYLAFDYYWANNNKFQSIFYYYLLFIWGDLKKKTLNYSSLTCNEKVVFNFILFLNNRKLNVPFPPSIIKRNSNKKQSKEEIIQFGFLLSLSLSPLVISFSLELIS